jgi:mRNA interferase RelE/StbE
LVYRVIISHDAEEHLRALTARQRSTVLDHLKEQLTYQPTVATRNRKLMEPNLIASWELRIGNIRVYYKVWEEEERTVEVIAIGIKVRSRVRCGDKEFEFP